MRIIAVISIAILTSLGQTFAQDVPEIEALALELDFAAENLPATYVLLEALEDEETGVSIHDVIVRKLMRERKNDIAAAYLAHSRYADGALSVAPTTQALKQILNRRQKILSGGGNVIPDQCKRHSLLCGRERRLRGALAALLAKKAYCNKLVAEIRELASACQRAENSGIPLDDPATCTVELPAKTREAIQNGCLRNSVGLDLYAAAHAEQLNSKRAIAAEKTPLLYERLTRFDASTRASLADQPPRLPSSSDDLSAARDISEELAASTRIPEEDLTRPRPIRVRLTELAATSRTCASICAACGDDVDTCERDWRTAGCNANPFTDVFFPNICRNFQ